MGFLPDHYDPPQSSGYMKLATGKNRFRVLSPAIVGNVFWKTNGANLMPVRRRIGEKIEASELETNDRGEREAVKHFWAFVVWNYATNAVQILEVTQATVRSAIFALSDSEEWGDPAGYDLVVTRSGEGLNTEYQVQPTPARPVDPGIVRAYQVMGINLDALFVGGDPFAGSKPANAAPAPGGHWTWPEALARCAAVGLTEAQLKMKMRNLGLTGYSPQRDTGSIKELIAAHKAAGGTRPDSDFVAASRPGREVLDGPGVPEEEVPF